MKGEEDYGLLILYPLLFSITYDTILFILCLSILTKRPLFLHLVTDPGAPYSINTEDFFFSRTLPILFIYLTYSQWLATSPTTRNSRLVLQMQHLAPQQLQLQLLLPQQKRVHDPLQVGISPLPSHTRHTRSATGVSMSLHRCPFTLFGIRMFVASSSFPSATDVYFTRWVFWFRQQHAPGNKITNYEEGIKKIASFSSVESFWGLQTHLSSPSALLPTTDYLLFHAGVRRPVWEDPLNRAGGKWIVRLRKGVADRVWEDLVMGVVGDMFDECGTQGDGEEGGWPEICGCTISVRQSEDIVSLWNRVDGDAKTREKIRCVFCKILISTV